MGVENEGEGEIGSFELMIREERVRVGTGGSGLLGGADGGGKMVDCALTRGRAIVGRMDVADARLLAVGVERLVSISRTIRNDADLASVHD